ncbi:CxC2 domain-containing protein [Mycena indigotica]|uniref:CxC2 domain-containing protein n=1 Tax=Mycena indigotica TaxID=2126181 RepID=A0A8H6WCV5_9AGAR|nr:CxC2 domain-containing protein [Mycena indigotica]KAF7311821.1 CxC2 domain-containing protein [Mycena indigotica]
MSWRKSRNNRRPRSPSPNDGAHVIRLHTGSIPSVVNAPIDAGIERMSADKRRTISEAIPALPPSPLKRLRVAALAPVATSTVDIEGDSYRMGVGDDDWEDGQAPFRSDPTPRVLRPADYTLRTWMLKHRDEYLRLMLWHEGRGASLPSCPDCQENEPVYRCRDCFGGAMRCGSCCVRAHRENPFHTIEFWNGTCFVRHSLKSLGLRIQLGHPPLQECDRPNPARDDFVLLHCGGIHNISVDFCGCHLSSDPCYIQLLRVGMFPASTDTPRTCATFSCLDQYHSLTLQGKITGYDYYKSLEGLTNATGLKPPDRYQVFLRMARQYRHLLSLKRGGRGYDGRGVLGTTPGELAIRCPACPRPGINLPKDWARAPPSQAGLYVFFLAIDACFRLKRRAFSNEIRDPALGDGDQPEEINTCTGLAALDYANTKYSRGYSATGVGMGVCARHEFVQPNGVADLQAGERHANMDYILASIIRHLHPFLRKMISYDIACQWWKKLFERLRALPPMLRLHLVLDVFLKLFIFVVPKLHILGHATACQLLYSLNFALGSRQTDGEGIERPWSMIGGVAASTCVSGPGARLDLLDDHWSYWNWSKLIGLPKIIRRRLDQALHEQVVQREAFDAFSLQQQERVSVWKAMVHDFEADGTKPNPYEAKIDGLTEAQVREQFEEEEDAQIAAGKRRIHDVGPVSFLSDLLDVESEQRRVAGLAELKKAKSTSMKINLQRLRRNLNKRIGAIQKLQATYMPSSLLRLRETQTSDNEALPENVPLFPPSALTIGEREAGCLSGLLEMEKAMREAQCRAALVGLQNQLLIKYRLLLYKTNHSRNQAMNTQSRALVARNESQVLLHSKKYQAAWRALVLIEGGREEAVGWKRLRQEDIRCLEDPEHIVKKDLRGQRAEARRARKEAELRAVGITPLNIHRVQVEGKSDEEEEGVTAVPGPALPRSRKLPIQKGTAI